MDARVTLVKTKDCKNVVRFDLAESTPQVEKDTAAAQNIYINKALVPKGKTRVEVSLKFLD